MGLLHPASGGHGLNLQEGGSTVIWYGLTWSLELYQQLNARLWRQGQSAGAVVRAGSYIVPRVMYYSGYH